MALFNSFWKLFERTEFILFAFLLVLVFIGFKNPSILLFFAVLFVLILVHEWGHFIVAKKTGMRVDEFGIGFPPKLFGRKYGETEYTLNALPIGGFVRIFGENYEEEVTKAASAADEAANSSVPVKSADYARAFSARPKWAQALVLVAGVTMNILFAWLLFTAALMVGVPAAADESDPSVTGSLSVLGVLPDSPAEAAGIPIGATILRLAAGADTLDAPTPSSFRDFIQAHPTEEIAIIYSKGETEERVVLSPESGLVEDDETRAAVGVSLAFTTIKQEPLLQALWLGAESTYNSFIAIAMGLWGLLSQTVSGTADFSQVAGPIGIAGLVGEAAEFGFTSLMLFTAMISLNLAVINLLPIPALDGGRLVFVAIEAITKREIPPVWAMRVNLAGFACLMLLMILVTYSDIVKII